MAVAFIDDTGATVTLGHELGRGGEGSVFEIPGSTQVAKIYHRPAEHSKAEKLEAMVRLKAPALTAVAAWPDRRIFDKSGTRTWGIVLPRVIDHREIHHLYSPAHRKIDFPTADWSFLIHVARNCAAAFDSIHSAGHVVGDVNQGGVLVCRGGTVKLIDCDSFQVSDGHRLFPCDVGVPHFTAPELQGRPFRGLQRAPTHDTFGLAVLIFHLLFMGRHPFAGRYHGAGDMPIELAIEQGRFAYGTAAARIQMTPPPHALRLTHVSPVVADLFERAFRHSAGQVTRPNPGEWVKALEDLKKTLVSCSRFAGHKFSTSAARSCPWCEIEKGGGPDLFISITASAKLNSTFDVSLLWRQVEAVPLPKPVAIGVTPVSGSIARTRLPSSVLGSGLLTLASGVLAAVSAVLTMVGMQVAGVWAAMGGLLWIVLRTQSPYAKERKRLLKDLENASVAATRAEAEWRSQIEMLTKTVAEKKQMLFKLRSDYQALPQKFRKEEEELQNKKREYQLNAFLRGHFIEDGSIKGIGPGRVSILHSFGIETALDVTPDSVRAVNGFGPTRTADVVEWRKSIEARFRFDPNRAVDPAERAALAQRQSQRRATLESALKKGLKELQQMSSTADQAWQSHQHRYAAAAIHQEQAATAARVLILPSWLA